MNMVQKISKIGNSAGILLPKEVLARLGAKVGDEVGLSSTENGFEITPRRDDFEAQMAAAREVMERRKRALRELAK